MKTFLVVAALLLALVGIVWFYRRRAAPPPTTHAASPPNILQQAEGIASKTLGAPLGIVGRQAQSAPLWVKLGVLPVGVTALTQDVIDHPVKTIGGAGKSIVGAGAAVGGAVAGGAKSVVHAFSSIF